jgi:RHS repeat-associated protein
VRLLDDDGKATERRYDALDRLIGHTLADGSTAQLVYDRDDNVVTLIDENNTTRTMFYDGLDRLIERRFAPDPSKRIAGGSLPMLVGTTEQRFQYDGFSRLTLATDNNDPADPDDDSTVLLAYDSLGRLVQETQDGRVVGSSYASDDRCDLHYPGAGQIVHFTYDAVDQLHQVSSQTGFFAQQSIQGRCCCDPIALLIGASPGTTTFKELTDLNTNKLAISRGIFRQSDRGVVTLETAARQRTNVQSGIALNQFNPDTAERIQNFASLGLSSVNQAETVFRALILPGEPPASQSYTIDFGGAQQIHRVSGSISQLNTFDAVHQHTTAGFQYNASPGTGIRTADPDFVYQWDALNRLRVVRSAASPATVIAAYRYDAAPFNTVGRRIEKVVTNSGSLDGTTRYVYDRDHVIEERKLEAGGERLDRQFIHGTLTDRPLAMDVDADLDGIPDTLFFYGRNIAGDVSVLADASGTPVEFYAHEAFKPPTVIDAVSMTVLPGSPNGNPYLSKGRQYDPETGLYYNRARYFDPISAVFMNRDPGGMWYDPSGFGNGLAYAGNNPWTASDPSGRALWVVPVLIVAGVAALAGIHWFSKNEGLAERVEPPSKSPVKPPPVPPAAAPPPAAPPPPAPPAAPAPAGGPATAFENIVERGGMRWALGERSDMQRYMWGEISRDDVQALNCEQTVHMAFMDMGIPRNPVTLDPQAMVDLRAADPRQYQAVKQLGQGGYLGPYGGYYSLAPADYSPCRNDVIIFFNNTSEAAHIAMFTGEGYETVENLGSGAQRGEALTLHDYVRYPFYAIYQYSGPTPVTPVYTGPPPISTEFTNDGVFLGPNGLTQFMLAR